MSKIGSINGGGLIWMYQYIISQGINMGQIVTNFRIIKNKLSITSFCRKIVKYFLNNMSAGKCIIAYIRVLCLV